MSTGPGALAQQPSAQRQAKVRERRRERRGPIGLEGGRLSVATAPTTVPAAAAAATAALAAAGGGRPLTVLNGLEEGGFEWRLHEAAWACMAHAQVARAAAAQARTQRAIEELPTRRNLRLARVPARTHHRHRRERRCLRGWLAWARRLPTDADQLAGLAPLAVGGAIEGFEACGHSRVLAAAAAAAAAVRMFSVHDRDGRDGPYHLPAWQPAHGQVERRARVVDRRLLAAQRLREHLVALGHRLTLGN